MNVPLIRSLNQQLISPQYRTPEEVLTWMGMKCSSIEKALDKVDEALELMQQWLQGDKI